MNYSNWLGPFLCKPTPTSMGFWLATGPASQSASIVVSISLMNKQIENVRLEPLSGSEYGVYIGSSSPSLTPNTKYSYSLTVDGIPFIPDGCEPEDLAFCTLPPEGGDAPFDFFLVSCNGIEEFEKHLKAHPKDKGNAWAMWERLLKNVQENPQVYLGVLAGDQVYMDETFEKRKNQIEKEGEAVIADIFQVYRKYWEHLSYRKIMARVPCLLMWDDHDLNDGFGSRPEQFDKTGTEKPAWSIYRERFTRAFYEMQAVRNPSGTTVPKGPFSFSTAWDDLGFCLLDLRSERNSVLKRLLKQEHKDYLRKSLEQSTAKARHIFFVSPVTAARMSGKLEASIGTISNFLWRIMAKLSYGPSIQRTLSWWVLFLGFYFGSQVRIHGFPGVISTTLLFCLSFAGCIATLWLNRGKAPANAFSGSLRHALWSTLILTGSYLLYQEFTNGLASALANQCLQATINAYERNSWVVFTSLAAFLTLDVARRFGARLIRLKVAGFLCLLATLILIVWTGMPGYGVGYWLIPMFIAWLLSILSLLAGVLEATGTTDMIAGLDDDLKDGWSSETNKNELLWLLEWMSGLLKRKVQPYFLSGDIHTGGISQIQIRDESNNIKLIPHVVSSPIAYVPMGVWIERLTASKSLENLPTSGSNCEAFNLLYRTQRNFVLVRTSSIALKREVCFEFYFEDLDLPMHFRNLTS